MATSSSSAPATAGAGGAEGRRPASRGPTMMAYIGSTLHVTLGDARELTGRFVAFDKHMNVVLADVVESRRSTKAAATNGIFTRKLGFVLLRGEHIVSVRTVKQPVAPPAAAAAKGVTTVAATPLVAVA